MQVIAECIADIMRRQEKAIEDVKARVKKLTDAHPLYKDA